MSTSSVSFILMFLVMTLNEVLPFLTLDPVHHNCVHFKLNANEYEQTIDGQLKFKDGTQLDIDTDDYTISLEDRTVQICHPITDQLKQCINLTKIPTGQYTVLHENMTLISKVTKLKRPLGSFYRTSGGDAVICSDEIQNENETGHRHRHQKMTKTNRRRCNYILLSPGEYKLDDQLMVNLMPSNEQMMISNYTLDPVNNLLNVCYPLTSEFLNCTSWWILENHEIEITPEKLLFSKPHGVTYGRGDYFLIDGRRAVTCSAKDGHWSSASAYVWHGVAQIISAVSLLAAIIIHYLIPQLSYQRAPLLCHATSLLIMYICLAIRQLVTPIGHSNCYRLFYFTYYSSLASFCWLTVLAYDLWRISWSLRSGSQPYTWVTNFTDRKFIKYATFGWLTPIAFTLLVALVDYYEHIHQAIGLYPYIAANCWFNERPSAMAFFYGPICVSLTINFILFGLIWYNIRFANCNVQFTNIKLNKELLVICSVVFMAMGFFWVMEVVTYMTTSNYNFLWIITDLVNALQGVVIAAVYTCRPLTWTIIKEKFFAPSSAPDPDK